MGRRCSKFARVCGSVKSALKKSRAFTCVASSGASRSEAKLVRVQFEAHAEPSVRAAVTASRLGWRSWVIFAVLFQIDALVWSSRAL